MVGSLSTWILCLGELFKVTFQTYIGQWVDKKNMQHLYVESEMQNKITRQ